MQLYSFFNSSTSYRVRIALAIKRLPHDIVPVDIRAGVHRDPGYVADINASASVPAVVDGDFRLGQSMAIIDWLDQVHPEPRLIPLETEARARVLELSNVVACDIHPVNNLRVLRYLQEVLHITPEQKQAWYAHWVSEGLAMVERLLARHGHGTYCFGEAPTLADCCLVPQVANARRMGCDTDGFERVTRVVAHAMAQPAFQSAQPQRQPDFG